MGGCHPWLTEPSAQPELTGDVRLCGVTCLHKQLRFLSTVPGFAGSCLIMCRVEP